VLILKIIFKKLKKIILIHFTIKNILKNNFNHTLPNMSLEMAKMVNITYYDLLDI
jgi:hypothetical protein